MLIIPAIDIRGGNCVMLKQGKIEDETVYSKDPAFMAKLWQAKGAQRLHVVDLDGAFNGVPQNLEIIRKIRSQVDIPIEVGGGIRSLKSIDALFDSGINHVIIGTLAVYNPDILRQALEKYGTRIVAAVDARDNHVAIGGWKDTTQIDAIELAQKLKGMGIDELIYTDIAKDGMMAGPNIPAIRAMAKTTGMKVIASGGVSRVQDISDLKSFEQEGIFGAIIGKALYTDDIKIEDALKIAEK
jgi:phosphoribosylformimino-5-aminoimidazole carboxamide ribotide isomerase